MKKPKWFRSKKFRKWTLIILAVIAVGECVYRICDHYQSKRVTPELIAEMKRYAKLHGMRDDVAVVVDFGISSKYNRMFVVDLEKGDILYKSKCAHGLGGGSTSSKPQFSNKHGSKCSSLGKYSIMKKDVMNTYKWVPCLRLKGLESTNSNAASRGILIHPGADPFQFLLRYWDIPMLPISEGCFTINLIDFNRLCSLRAESNKPILLNAVYNLE